MNVAFRIDEYKRIIFVVELKNNRIMIFVIFYCKTISFANCKLKVEHIRVKLEVVGRILLCHNHAPVLFLFQCCISDVAL